MAWAIRISLALSALIMLAAIALILARGKEISGRIMHSVNCRIYLPSGVHANSPHCSTNWKIGTHDVPIKFNSRGFRDQERSKRPRAGVIRVALLGGSTMLGLGLPGDAFTPGWLVEKKLAQRGIRNVEVLNLAVESYEITRHEMRVPEYLDEFSPDVIIVEAFRDSKIIRDVVRSATKAIHPRGSRRNISLIPFRGIIPNSVRMWLRQSLFSYRLAKVAFLARFTHPDPVERTEFLMRPQLESISRMKKACGTRCKVAAFLDPAEHLGTRSVSDAEDEEIPAALKHAIFTAELDTKTKVDLLARGDVIMMNAEGRLPTSEEREMFIGHSRYYSERGMDRFAEVLADSLIHALKLKPHSSAKVYP
jgi:hypothetical protein